MNIHFECWTCGNTTDIDECKDCKTARRVLIRGKRNLDNPNNVFNSYPHLQQETRVNLRLFTSGSEVKIPWKCKDCGNKWVSAITNRTVSGSGCPECSKKKVWEIRKSNLPNEDFLQWGRPDLWEEVVDKETAQEKRYLLGSDEKILWKCKKCGREWKAFVYSRTGPMNAGCVSCSHRDSWKSGGERDIQRNTENFLKIARPDLYEELVWHPHGENVTIGSQMKALWRCKECCFEWKAVVCNRTSKEPTGCPNCANNRNSSKGEEKVYQYISSITDLKIIRHYRGLGKEIDVFLPELKLGIEYNGVYWHSEPYNSKWVHWKKRKHYEKEGIRLFIIWEDDWKYKKNIIQNQLKNLVGVTDSKKINARDCHIDTKIENTEARKVLEANHIQGMGSGGSIKVGLRNKEGLLVALAVFKTLNKSKMLSLERYVTNGVLVRGGLGKITKWVEKCYNGEYNGIITFADCSISQGSVYERVGFHFVEELEPDYTYLVKDKRVHKFNYRKNEFYRRDDLLYEEGLSEAELAKLNKLYRVWDYGKKRYIYWFNQN